MRYIGNKGSPGVLVTNRREREEILRVSMSPIRYLLSEHLKGWSDKGIIRGFDCEVVVWCKEPGETVQPLFSSDEAMAFHWARYNLNREEF